MDPTTTRRDMRHESLKTSGDFHTWLKMAADNKINAKNSWTLALIDYFYDLSFEPVTNFQKMSAILDGCMKIYSSRVDSAVNETGTLLSGLSSNEQINNNVSDIEDSAEAAGDERGVSLSREAVSNRVRKIRENTLVSSFHKLRIKNLDKDLIVDPMFKKTLAHFDEGGSKSLLLNTLTTDNNGRLVFDSNPYSKDTPQVKPQDASIPDHSWDMMKHMLTNGPPLEELQITQSLETLKKHIQNLDEPKPAQVKFSDTPISIVGDVDDLDYGDEFNDYNDLEFNDDNDNEEIDGENVDEGMDYESVERYHSMCVPDLELMNYFDNTMKRGVNSLPVYWKVKRLQYQKSDPGFSEKKQPSQQKDEKSVVDFHSSIEEDVVFEDEIFSTSVAKIYIPRKTRKNGYYKNKFRLENEGKMTSQRLTKLFLIESHSLSAFQKTVTVEQPEVEDSYTYYGDEPSRLLDEITREDIDELNKSYIEDFSQPLPGQSLMKSLNYEKISKRIDIGAIKEIMVDKVDDGVKFTDLAKDIPSHLNGSTSVYFICLLHLCNEQNLNLKNTDNDDLLVYRNT